MKVLLIAATEAEILPFIDAQRSRAIDGQGHDTDVLITGVGLMATTFSLTKRLSENSYDLVLQAGIAGAFDRSLVPGQLVIVKEEIMGDLGAEDHDQFIDVFELGFAGKNDAPFSEKLLVNSLDKIPFEIKHSLVRSLSVDKVSGSERTIAERTERYQAQIETMEGAALHYACLQMNVAFLQLRAISNYITPRDRKSWQIPLALKNLNEQLCEWLLG